MPRPNTVTDADIIRWRSYIAENLATEQNPGMRNLLRQCLENEFLAERGFYTGAWLGERLAELGCPKEVIRMVCVAHCRKVIGSDDPWQLAQEALAGMIARHRKEARQQ
jgi:hypothetical protein